MTSPVQPAAICGYCVIFVIGDHVPQAMEAVITAGQPPLDQKCKHHGHADNEPADDECEREKETFEH